MQKQGKITIQEQNSRPRVTPPAACPVCRSANISSILEIPRIPVLCNVLWERREDALSAAQGVIQLSFCDDCGHLFNRAFDPDLMRYDVQYENSLHFSPLFQRYAAWLAHHLVDQYNLRGKNIVEIGSGKGDFLRLLCEYGDNQGTGFDPSYEPVQEDAQAEADPRLTFIKDIYSERYSSYPADFILSRHVLEHIYHPGELVRSLRRTIGGRKQTAVYFEVPNLGYILRDTAIWDIIYEHYSYFSAPSLARLFTLNGFNVLNLATAFDDQFLYIEAAPGDIEPGASSSTPSFDRPNGQPVDTLIEQVARFGERSHEKLDHWKEQVENLRKRGKRAVLWGAGSKGISFLNMLQSEQEVRPEQEVPAEQEFPVAYVVDINPRKHGKYITGAGQQIVSPDFLKRYRPDTVIIMNPIYREEIQGMVEQQGLRHVEYLFAS